jgi:hypothetical protein
MDFLSEFSDDQIALIGCFVALVSCGGIVSLSHYLGGHSRSKRGGSQQAAESRDNRLRIARSTSKVNQSRRKAA